MDIKVYNGSGQPHFDRWNGMDFSFPPDSTVVIPAEAATHIFGMGLTDRYRQIVRLGWAPTSAEMAQAIKRLDSFLFEDADVEEDAPEEIIAAKLERPTAGQIDPAMAPMKPRIHSVLSKAQ
jgi:hypothetical protein